MAARSRSTAVSASTLSSPSDCPAGIERFWGTQHRECVSILVVDDEPDVADLFRQRFRREACQGTYVMHFAASGVEALDRLAGEIQPTLAAVLSDINMPGMDGLQLLGEIKQRRPDLPVMMITACGATTSEDTAPANLALSSSSPSRS